MKTELLNRAANQTYMETIRLHYKKDKTITEQLKENAVRKENPMLDQMLYDADKADILKEMSAAKNLMLKIARGEALTESEKKFLEENYPEYADKAEQAKEQADRLKEQIRNAKTPEEKQSIIMQAYSMVQGASEQEVVYGQALAEAVKTVLSEESKECTITTDKEQGQTQRTASVDQTKRYRLEEKKFSIFNQTR